MPSPFNDRSGFAEELVVAVDGPSPKSQCPSELLHLHVCVYCGHARKREDISGREMGSGIFHCPLCESDGPLNVEIREA